MGLVTGDVVAITYNGEYAGQQIRNVLHYRAANNGTSVTPEGDLLAIAQDFAAPGTNPITTALQNCAVTDMAWTGVTAQRVFPTRTIAMTQANSWPGGIAATGMPPNTAAVITKRTNQPGRRGVGSIHITAIDQTNIVNGVLTSLLTFDDLATEMLASYVVAAITLTLDPGLYNPGLAPFNFTRLDQGTLSQPGRVPDVCGL